MENKLFSKWAWKHRKEFCGGSPNKDGSMKQGTLYAIDSIFPWAKWIIHPITSWKYRNTFLIIPGFNDKSCDDLNCGNAACKFLREEGK